MTEGTVKPARKKRKRIVLIILGVLLVGLIIFRLFLPSIVLRYVNKELDNIPDYKGHVDKITISLWRGAYQIQGITLNKMSGKVPVPFFASRTIDLSVEWRALFHGSIVAKIKFLDPQVNFVSGPTEASSQKGIDSSWIQTLKKLTPFKINRVDIINGEIHYRDFYSNPKVDIHLDNVEAWATNLTNGNKEKEVLPAKVQANATCFQTGLLDLHIDIDPLSVQPTFELKEKMRDVKLVNLNDFFEAYADFQVKSGNFGLYTEVASKNGDFVGYTKPFFENLKVDKKPKDNPTVLKELWANVVSATGWVLTNHKTDQLATKVPLHGHFSSVNMDIWPTIGNLLRNAFIEALLPSLDENISIGDVNNASGAIGEMKKEKKDAEDTSKKKKKKHLL